MGLKLIGAGLGRTGTLSIKLALEQLGLGACYHMTEIFMNPSHVPLWLNAVEGRADWEGIFAGYLSSVDYPGCTFWRELTQFYPKAKVLLSVRDPGSWFESTQATIFSAANIERITGGPLKEFAASIILRDLGERIHDREFMIDYFTRHNAMVQRSIPADRLLVYQAAQGWEPLCRFLGVSVPEKAFPRANTSEDFKRSRAEAAAREGPADPAAFMRERLARLREQN